MGLKLVYPHELQPGDVVVRRGENFKIDLVAVGRPSKNWVTVHTKTPVGDGSMVLMLPADERINVVVVRDKKQQRESAQRKDASWQSRRVRGSNR